MVSSRWVNFLCNRFYFSFSNFSFIFNYKEFVKRGKKKKVEWEQKREKGPIWSHFRAFYGFNKAEVIHKRPHIHLCRMNGLSTLKVATFDGAFFMSNDVGEHKIFFFGDFAIQYFFTTRVLTVYRMDILMTVFISIIIQCEDISDVRVHVFHMHT